MLSLTPPRHTSTLRNPAVPAGARRMFAAQSGRRRDRCGRERFAQRRERALLDPGCGASRPFIRSAGFFIAEKLLRLL